MENKRRTRAATAFIDHIYLSHTQDIAITSLSYVQDISRHKNTVAYDYMEFLIGHEMLEEIAKIEKTFHRYGIFIDSFNNDIAVMEIRKIAGDDHQLGRISMEQYLMVTSMENPVQAAIYLAYERKKAEKQKQLEAMSLIDRQRLADEEKHKRQVELETIKGRWMRLARREEATGFSNAAAFNAKASITREQMKQDGQNNRQAQKAIDEIDLLQSQINAKATAGL